MDKGRVTAMISWMDIDDEKARTRVSSRVFEIASPL
jgi:hypothetical protein